jgi:4-amino-4-deoxychorismate lyase
MQIQNIKVSVVKQSPFFIETIKLRNGQLHNLVYHNQRANAARREVLNIKKPLKLEEHIEIGAIRDNRIYKCRVTFGKDVTSVDIELYRKKKIKRLRLVDGNNIDYRYKYADRTAIDTLFAQRGTCDDILIVKDGCLTDTSYANVAFFDGTEWYTPSTPLLAGTKRRQLIDEGAIKEKLIRPKDLPGFDRAVLFNALIDFDSRKALPISCIGSQ